MGEDVEAAGRPVSLGAVVLAGGTAARLGGVDKASLELDGTTLLERALAATRSAAQVVVVGEQVPTSRPVAWAREDPPGGGPAAGLLAGLDRLLPKPDLVAVLAVDMPRVTQGTFARLVGALGRGGQDGAVLVDDRGRVQPLCAVYRCRSLLAARPRSIEQEHALPVRRLIQPLSLVQVPAVGQEALDVDTWQDLGALRRS